MPSREVAPPSLLTAGGCDQLQGYYFSPPLPVDEFTRILERGVLGDEPPKIEPPATAGVDVACPAVEKQVAAPGRSTSWMDC